MKCHYIKVKGVGKVLIPGCMAVAVSNDIADCTCHDILTEADFERQRHKDVVDRMKKEIAELREENEILRKGYIKIIERCPPIINPLTLSEEQREAIREQYIINKNLTQSEVQNAYQIGIVQTFEWLFGSGLFKKGE